jgi:hypothetical protein
MSNQYAGVLFKLFDECIALGFHRSYQIGIDIPRTHSPVDFGELLQNTASP